MSNAEEWDFTDGWILMSVFLAGGSNGAELHTVLGAADAMNHAIPTPEELSTSLTKLSAANVVKITGGVFAIRLDYLLAIKDAYAGRGGLFTSPDKGRRWLKRSKVTPDAGFVRVDISEADHLRAYKRYRLASSNNKDV